MSKIPRSIERGFFTAEDFKHVTLGHHGATPTIEQTAANIANAGLRDWLKEQPEATCLLASDGQPAFHIFAPHTHSARLVDVKEIEK